jgi:hypothetical protein
VPMAMLKPSARSAVRIPTAVSRSSMSTLSIPGVQPGGRKRAGHLIGQARSQLEQRQRRLPPGGVSDGPVHEQHCRALPAAPVADRCAIPRDGLLQNRGVLGQSVSFCQGLVFPPGHLERR